MSNCNFCITQVRLDYAAVRNNSHFVSYSLGAYDGQGPPPIRDPGWERCCLEAAHTVQSWANQGPITNHKFVLHVLALEQRTSLSFPLCDQDKSHTPPCCVGTGKRCPMICSEKEKWNICESLSDPYQFKNKRKMLSKK